MLEALEGRRRGDGGVALVRGGQRCVGDFDKSSWKLGQEFGTASFVQL